MVIHWCLNTDWCIDPICSSTCKIKYPIYIKSHYWQENTSLSYIFVTFLNSQFPLIIFIIPQFLNDHKIVYTHISNPTKISYHHISYTLPQHHSSKISFNISMTKR